MCVASDCENPPAGRSWTMQIRVFLTVVGLVFACLSAGAEPKAYEVVKYKGKAGSVTIALDYGDGYVHASHMWVTDRKSGKSTQFMLDDSGEMRFVPKKQGGSKKEVVLKMSMDDGPLATIDGTYTVDGKQTQFTLRRIE
jgi:hypothetical protein